MNTRESVFAVPKMDCPSEERMIRTALDGLRGSEASSAISPGARFASSRRRAFRGRGASRTAGPGASLVSSGAAMSDAIPAPLDAAREAQTLKILLAINAVMFVAELTVAWFAESAGLLAIHSTCSRMPGSMG